MHRDGTLTSPSSVFKSTQLPHPVVNKLNAHMTLASRPTNQGQIISSFTHFGPAAPQFVRGDPKHIRPNFLGAPYNQYHYSNGYTGHLTPSGHFVAKNNYPSSLHFSPNGAGSYQFTNTFIPSAGVKPSSEALHFVNPSSQIQQQNPAPPQPSPSHLPALPTVPPSVLSPFFQQVQQQQQEAVSTASTATQAPNENNNNNVNNLQNSNSFQLLNDEYTINLVPPPFKHTDSTRFRGRQPVLSSTTPIPSTTPVPLPTGPSPSPSPADFFDEEQQKALEILNKYNIPAISPLQDNNRYSYNSGPLIVLSSTPNTPSSYSDAQIYQHIWQNNTQAAFTTEKPHLFRNEYIPHKVVHHGFTGVKRPHEFQINPSPTPFLPTPDSGQNNAITHSFFTIEDAITLSPHLHYRRPVLPTNANEIEVSIKTPQNEDFIKTASSPDTPTEVISEQNERVTLQPPPSTPDQKLRNRNKLRRKRPKPTTENTIIINEQKPQRNKLNEEKDENKWDTQTEMPKNHKEYTATRERGPPGLSYRDTTSESPREATTTSYNSYRNGLRTRNRTRISSATETTSERPQRIKKPTFNADQRRPNNRFEDNKIQRQRPHIEKTTRAPDDDNEETTINLRDNGYLNNYNKHSRRPTTTPQPISVSTTADDEQIDFRPTEAEEFYREEKLSNRLRNGNSPSTISSIISPTIQNIIIDTTHAHLEENQGISSTRFTMSSEPTATHEVDFSGYEEEFKATDPNDIITTQNIPSSLSSVASANSDKDELNKEVIITPDGPIFIGNGPVYKAEDIKSNDDTITSPEPSRHRQRLRNKDKIMEAVAAATLSSSSSTKIPRGRDENEVNDTEKEKDGKLRLRLPVFKAPTKQIEDQGTVNSTKPTRLNNANKFDSKYRPRFSIKEHRQRLTTSSTTTPDPSQSNERDSTTSPYPRLRFPTRTRLLPTELKNKNQDSNKIDEKSNNAADLLEKPIESSSEQSTETTRKRFVPKDRYSSRVKSTTELSDQAGPTAFSTPLPSSTPKPTQRRGSTRRDYLGNRTRYSTSTTPYPSFDHTVTRVPIIRNASVPLRRPPAVNLRQRIQEKKKKEQQTSTPLTIDDSLNDLAVESSSEDKISMTSIESNPPSSSTSSSTEEYKHETAIMKIAKDDHSYRPHMHKDKMTTTTEKTPMTKLGNDLSDSPSQQSERVAELTIFGSNQFNSVNTGGAPSRRIPGYFTLATEDPILPIEAFFPQVKKN